MAELTKEKTYRFHCPNPDEEEKVTGSSVNPEPDLKNSGLR